MKSSEQSQPKDRLDRAIHHVQQDVAPPIDPNLDTQILAQANLETEPDSSPTPWRLSMKQLLKIAAVAAVLLIVALVGPWLMPGTFNSQAVLAMAIEKVRAVQAFGFVATIQIPGQDKPMRIKTLVANPGWMRQEMDEPTHVVTIIDFKNLKVLSLITDSKQAKIIDISGLPEDQIPKDMVEEFTKIDPEYATYLRDEQHNGVTTHLYETNSGPLGGFVWIDVKTKMPVQIEVTMSGLKGQATSKIVMDQFDWNVQVDESTFSMEIPQGYTTQQIDMSNPTEADLVMVLRSWAALTQEPFPDDLGPGNIGMIGQMMRDPTLTPEQNKQRLVERLSPLFGAEAMTDPNWQKTMAQFGETFGRATLFMATLEKAEWRWVGSGVFPGPDAADKPLCWWKFKDAKAYRVIFGDFTVRDVEPDDLPNIP